MLDVLEERLKARTSTPMTNREKRDHGEGRVQEQPDKGLFLLGLRQEDLKRTPKAWKEKRVLAWFIKKETTATLRWLSETLNMEHTSNVSSVIRMVELDEDSTFKALKKKAGKILKN